MIKTITFAKKFCHVLSIFKALNILKIDDIYQLGLGKFRYQTFNGNIPQKIDKDFIKLTYINIVLDILPINSTYPEQILAMVTKCYHLLELSFGLN